MQEITSKANNNEAAYLGVDAGGENALASRVPWLGGALQVVKLGHKPFDLLVQAPYLGVELRHLEANRCVCVCVCVCVWVCCFKA